MRQPGRTNDPQGTRRRIIDAAFAAFTTRGYHATALHDLRGMAGVTGGAFAHHFPTKKALALAVIRDGVTGAVRETWIEPIRTSRSALEGIRSVFTGVADQLDRNKAVSGCPLNNLVLELASQEPEFRELMDAIFSEWQRVLADKFREDLSQDRVKGIDPESLATFVVATYSGAMAIAKSQQDAKALRASLRQLSNFLKPRYLQDLGQS